MHPRELSIQEWTYALPADRIATQPLPDRDGSRLLVAREGRIMDHVFHELPDLLPDNALLVLNDTRVVSARIRFQRATGAQLECMIMDPMDGRPMEDALADRTTTRWWCMMGNSKRWKGEVLVIRKNDLELTACRIDERRGEHLIEFSWNTDVTFVHILELFGSVPLPPYMRRAAMSSDVERYNTVFAAHDGSIAAPTASLHFSGPVMEALAARGVRSTRLTLHVGAGTFLPVKSERMADHSMHSEQVRVPLATLKTLLDQLDHGAIVAVGTTAMRTLESIYWHGVSILRGGAGERMLVGQWEPYGSGANDKLSAREALTAVITALDGKHGELTGTTSLMIAPGYTFRMAEALVTNFHQPQSTLLLLVAAFVGPSWRDIYAHALGNGYRFLSYGDGSLLFRHEH